MIKRTVSYFLIKQNLKCFRINELYSDIRLDDEDNSIVLSSPGVWSIDPELAKVLLYLIYQTKPESVIEFGAGYSTYIFKYVLRKRVLNFQLISVEENLEWFNGVCDSKNNENEFENSKIFKSKVSFTIGFFGLYARYDSIDLRNIPNGISFVFIDGPQYYYGREGNLDFVYSKLNNGAIILVDDAGRYIDQVVLYKWLKIYKGLGLIHFDPNFGNKGYAILRVNGKLKRSFSVFVFLLGIIHGIKRIWNLKISKRRN